MWFRGGKRVAPSGDGEDAVPRTHSIGQIVKAVALGVGIGLITGIVGAGGGIMILLVLVFVPKFPLHKAIGTSTLIMAITAMSGAVGYGLQGQIDLLGGILVGAGAIAGGISSARLANTVSEQRLARIGASVFVVLGLVMTFLQYSGGAVATHG